MVQENDLPLSLLMEGMEIIFLQDTPDTTTALNLWLFGASRLTILAFPALKEGCLYPDVRALKRIGYGSLQLILNTVKVIGVLERLDGQVGLWLGKRQGEIILRLPLPLKQLIFQLMQQHCP